MPYKTPLYHHQSNGIAERMIQTVKIGLKAFSPFNQNIEAYIPNLLINYRTVPHADRNQGPSALMDRQIRAPITMSFATEKKVWYKRNKYAESESGVHSTKRTEHGCTRKKAANISPS